MSSLTKLAALRMQLAELERTPCARCEHPLSAHRLNRRVGAECRTHVFVPGKTTSEWCPCFEFADSLDEQLSLDPQKEA